MEKKFCTVALTWLEGGAFDPLLSKIFQKSQMPGGLPGGGGGWGVFDFDG